MMFVLEVDLGAGAIPGNPAAELGRILRYWAGNVKHYALDVGDQQVIYDSGYTAVGSWTIRAEEPPAA